MLNYVFYLPSVEPGRVFPCEASGLSAVPPFLTDKASITHVHPVKIRSIPTNRPITKAPDWPLLPDHDTKTRLMMPPTSVQPQCGNRYIDEPMIRKSPPTISAQARK